MAAPWSEGRFQKSQVPILPPIQSPKQSLVAPTQSRAVVPYNPSRSSNTIEQLESRLNALEQAHKMLLEELVNTQSHSQAWITHHEKAGQLREKEIVSVREALGLSSSTLNQVLNQVRENERRLDAIQTKMDQLADTTHYHDSHHSQQKLAQQVQQLQDTFHHLQEQCSLLKQESHQHKESISTGLAGLTTSLTSQGRSGAAAIRDLQESMTILEEEQKALASGLSKLDGIVVHLESSQVQMRKLVETRSDETWSILNDLRAQLTAMDMHKKKQDYWLKQSFSEIHEKLSQFSHTLMTSVNGVSSKIKQTEDQSIEKQAELVSRVWEELKERERQWKEERDQREKELQHQLNEFERYLKTNAPQEHINQHDIVLANLEKQCTEFKEMYKKSQDQFDKSISTLTKSVSLLEKESQVTKKHLSSVLEAEIKTRREEILTLQSQCANLQESCHRSHESIQLLMDKLQTTISGNTNMVQESISKLHSEWQEAHKRLLVDIGARITTLHSEVHSEVSSQDKNNVNREIHSLQEQIQVSLENMSHLQKTVDTLEKNCCIISQKSDNNSAITQEIHTRTVETDNKIYQVANTMQDLQIKLLGEIRNESRQRYQELHQVKNDLGWLQISLRKLLYPNHASHQVTMTAPPFVYLPHTIEEVDTKPHPLSGDHDNTDPLHESEDEEETDPIEPAHARPFGESPTPEPRSLHSSPSGTHKLRRSRPSRRGRNALPLNTIQIQEPPETMGTFTSAPPTPDNQRIILVNEETIDREEISQEDERERNHLFENTSNLPTAPHLLSPSLLTETHHDSNTCVFIKYFADEEESNGERVSWLNEWGIYQALRLLQMKEKLMRPVNRLRERKLQENENS